MADLEAHGPKPTHAWIQTLSSANSTHEQPKPIQRPSTLTWIIVCAAILTGSFLYGLDNTIAADVQASVYQQFHDSMHFLPTPAWKSCNGVFLTFLDSRKARLGRRRLSHGFGFNSSSYWHPLWSLRQQMAGLRLLCRLRSRQRSVRCSAKHQCLDCRPCDCGHGRMYHILFSNLCITRSLLTHRHKGAGMYIG